MLFFILIPGVKALKAFLTLSILTFLISIPKPNYYPCVVVVSRLGSGQGSIGKEKVLDNHFRPIHDQKGIRGQMGLDSKG